MKRKDFIDSIRRQLLKRREDLIEDVSGQESLLKTIGVTTEPGDAVDHANESLVGEISAQLAEVEFREIANIDQALCRMNDATYGVCEGCRKTIPMMRLEAIPHATLCIDCKRLAEEHGVAEGSKSDWSMILEINNTISRANTSIS